MRIEFLKAEIKKVIPEDEYNELIYELRQKWPLNIESLLTIVSGKDYLIPLIHFRLKKLKGFGSVNVTTKSLRMRLAKLTKIDKYSNLIEVVRNI
jgi:hypothetical protein